MIPSTERPNDREGRAGLQWVFPPGVERHVTEPDEFPSLWISPEGENWKRLKLSRWLEDARPLFGFPQIAVGDGCPELVFTFMNMERYDNCLAVIPEEELLRWYDQAEDPPAAVIERLGRR